MPRLLPILSARLSDGLALASDRISARIDSAITTRAQRVALGVAQRLDAAAAMANSLTGLGGSRDKAYATQYREERATGAEKLTARQLEVAFRFGGYERRYLDNLVESMTKEGWDVIAEDASIPEIEEEEKRLRLLARIKEGLRVAFVSGGALVVLLTDDPAELSQPLTPESLVRIRGLLVLEGETEFTPALWEGDPESPQFRMPSAYHLSPEVPSGRQALSGAVVHWTRTLYLPGRPVLPTHRVRNNGIDDPLIEAVRHEAANLRTIGAAGARQAHELRQDVIKIQGLAELEAGKLWETVRARLRAMTVSRSEVNAVLLGDGETFETRAQSATGYKELRDGAKSDWSAVTRQPQTIAFGDAPSGLKGGRDESGERQWSAEVESWQESHLRPALERLYELLLAQDHIGGDAPAEWALVFHPVIRPSPSEAADLRLKTSQADQIDIDSGILTAEHVRRGRYGAAGWRQELPPMVEEDLDDGGDLLPDERTDADTVKVPESARNNARKVLRWREEHPDEIQGMTPTGWAMARKIAGSSRLPKSVVRRMGRTLLRHQKNQSVDPENKATPWKDAGRVTWLGWGGASMLALAETLFEAEE